MPDPRDPRQSTGEPAAPEAADAGSAAAQDEEVESTPGRGENQAGFLKEREGTEAGRDRNYG